MKTIIFIYIVGVLFAITHFANEVKNTDNNPIGLTLLEAIFFVLQDTRHFRYTLQSWFYFI